MQEDLWDNCKKEIQKERTHKKSKWKKGGFGTRASLEFIAAANGEEKIR